MTTTKENKVLSVAQYEFYKKGDTPMADTAIGKIYGMNPNQLNAFKQENGLIGKYRKKTPWQENSNSALYTGKKVEVQPLREKEIEKAKKAPQNGWERVGVNLAETGKVIGDAIDRVVPSSSSVDRKTPTISQAEVMERHDSQNNALNSHESDSEPTGDKIIASDLQRLVTSIDADLAKRVDLDKFQHEENQEYIAELLDEVADLSASVAEQKENAKGWERKYYEELGRGDSWRNKCQDAERKIEKLKEQIGIEQANRKYAEKRMDEALTTSYRNEQLSVDVMRKVVEMAERVEVERV